MDERLKRIKELFSEIEKRNGELVHENFKLKKREDGYCTVINAHTFDDAFCSCGERKE